MFGFTTCQGSCLVTALGQVFVLIPHMPRKLFGYSIWLSPLAKVVVWIHHLARYVWFHPLPMYLFGYSTWQGMFGFTTCQGSCFVTALGKVFFLIHLLAKVVVWLQHLVRYLFRFTTCQGSCLVTALGKIFVWIHHLLR